jgi:hypothetical protein
VNRLGSAPQVAAVSPLDERSTSPDGRIGIVEVTYAAPG